MLVQVVLVAQRRGRSSTAIRVVQTADVDAPTFTQPPLVRVNGPALSARLAVSKASTVYWAAAYADVQADYRNQLLGFSSSDLSTQQVLELAASTDTAAALRRLHQAGGLRSQTGPVISSGEMFVSEPNRVVDVPLDSPCLNNTGMCSRSSSALNPLTEYQVCMLLFMLAGSVWANPKLCPCLCS